MAQPGLGSSDQREAGRLTVRILLGLALAEFERSGLGAAEGLLDAALEAAIDAHDEELEALTHSQRAMALGRSGQMGRALGELDRGSRLIHRLAPRDQWVMAINRGMVRSHLFDVAGARRDFARALAVARTGGLEAQEYMAAHNLGYAAYLAGDMPEALRLMSEADALAGEVSRAVPHLDRGRVLLEAGLGTEAEAMLTSALDLCTDRRQQQIRGEIELDLARARWSLGRSQDALRLARSAERRFHRRSAPLWAHRAHLLGLQVELAQTRSPVRIAGSAVKLAERGRAEHDRVLEAHSSLVAAQAFLRAEHVEDARHWLVSVAPLRRSAALSTRLQIHLLDAELAARAAQRRRASAILGRAARELHDAQGVSASLDVRTARAVHGQALAELDTRLATSRGAAAVLACTERWRAATASLPAITPPADEVLAGLLTQLRAIEEQIRDSPEASPASLRAEEARIRHGIRSRDWQLRSEGPRPPGFEPLRVGELRAALQQRDCALVSYFVQQGALHEVSMVGGRAAVRPVADADSLARLARRAHTDLQAFASYGTGPLGEAIRASLDQSLGALDQLLLPSVALRRGALVVVPTSALALLPWNMLPSRHGLPTTVATSARAWLSGARILTKPRVSVAVGPALPGAQEEGHAVARIWQAAAPTRPESAAALRHAFTSADLVHVAAHGRHEPQSPLFSSLRMADGPLFAHELTNAGASAAHVVLSACDVGQSTLRPGDEPLGLSACLLYLGAAAVVAPVCRVPDTVASDTMRAYHERLRRGVDAAEALAEAGDLGDPLGRAFSLVGSPLSVAA